MATNKKSSILIPPYQRGCLSLRGRGMLFPKSYQLEAKSFPSLTPLSNCARELTSSNRCSKLTKEQLMKIPEVICEAELRKLQAHWNTSEMENAQEYRAFCFAGTEVARSDSIEACRTELLRQATAKKAEFLYFHPWVEHTSGLVSGCVSVAATILLPK